MVSSGSLQVCNFSGVYNDCRKRRRMGKRIGGRVVVVVVVGEEDNLALAASLQT
jgi:hypothetical protein